MKAKILIQFAFSLLFGLVLLTSCEKEDPNEIEYGYGIPVANMPNAIRTSITGSPACFTFNYPLEIQQSNGAQKTFSTDEEILAYLDIWEQTNPLDAAFPDFIYPLEVTLADGVIFTLPDQMILDYTLNSCMGIGEED